MARAVHRLTVLYDAGCPLCRFASSWLAGQAQLVPVALLPAGSTAARRAFPDLDHAATLRDLTVVADTGAVYTGDAAWLICLWALDGYRALSIRLAAPAWRGAARKVVEAAAAARRRSTGTDYGDRCADQLCDRTSDAW